MSLVDFHWKLTQKESLMNKLIHLTSNFPLKDQNVYVAYDAIQAINRHECRHIHTGEDLTGQRFGDLTVIDDSEEYIKEFPEHTCIFTRNQGQFLVDEQPAEVYRLIQEKIDEIEKDELE